MTDSTRPLARHGAIAEARLAIRPLSALGGRPRIVERRGPAAAKSSYQNMVHDRIAPIGGLILDFGDAS